ncbi:MAG: CHAD domain-containing protein [Actinomycetota bacterium]
MSTNGGDQGGPEAAPAGHEHGASTGQERGPSPPPPHAEPGLEGPAGELLLHAVRGHFLQLAKLAGPARRKAPDAVHQMRTATRRMRSVLKAYRKLLDPPPDRLQAELKWLAGELAAARDAEVQAERLGRLLAAALEDQTDGEAPGHGQDNRAVLPAAPGTAPAARRLNAELAERLDAGHRQVMLALNGKRYRRLITDIEDWLDHPQLAPLASEPARQVVPRLVGRQFKRLRAAASSALAAPEGTELAEETLHEARKRAKGLRYAAEAAAMLSPVDVAGLGQAAHEIQSVLGDHQDAVVARQLLRRLAAKAAREGEDTFLYGRLDALEQAAAKEAVSRFHELWRRFPSAKPKSWGKPWEPA